jgi:trk system potassium uptake protein
MRKTVLVIGLGRFGGALALSLVERGAEVVGLDRDPAIVDAMKAHIDNVMVGDVGHPETIASMTAGVDVAVVALGLNLEQAILAVMRLKEAGVPRVVARATNDEAQRIFEKLGADEVVRPMKEAAEHLAGMLTSVNAVDFMLLGENFAVIEYEVGPSSAGKTLKDLAWRRRFHVVAIGVKRGLTEEDRDEVHPVDPDDKLRAGDRVLLVGRTRDLDTFQKEN